MQGEETPRFRLLLRRSAWGLLVTAALVIVCYFFVDKPTAFYVSDHGIYRIVLFDWLTQTPMVFNALAAVVVVVSAILRAWGPLSRVQSTLLGAAVSLMVAISLEWYLKWLFGRYWPGTWVHGNPSLLDTDDYGFHPFHFGEWYGSFPSGHTARVFSVLTVVWSAYPRLFWPGLFVCASVVVGLVGMNYHFVGDTVGGAYLGLVTGAYTAAFFGLSRPSQNLP